MHLFIRRARMAPGQTRASMAWAVEITDRVRQVTGMDVSLHALVLSPDVGEVAWRTLAEDMAALETAFDKLLIDDFFVAEQDRAASFTLGPPTDSMQRIVHGQLPRDPLPYVSLITTTCRPGRVEAGMTAAIELATRATEISGAQTAVTMHETGPYGTISWITPHPGIESLDAADEALATDARWAGFVDERVADNYTDDPMASVRRIYRRIA
jgi:hypothetical protein